MMTVDAMLSRLLQVCPSSRKVWEDHLEWWAGRERGYYNDMTVFARHIVESWYAGSRDEMKPFFALVEDCITHGDSTVRDLATIGLLEDIQTISSHRAQGDRPFEEYLGPAAAEAWAHLNMFWAGQGSLMDVVRAEKRAADRQGDLSVGLVNSSIPRCRKCGCLYDVFRPPSRTTRATLAEERTQGRILSCVKILWAINGVGLGEAKATAVHLAIDGTCHNCGATLPKAEFQDCPSCGALNIRWDSGVGPR